MKKLTSNLLVGAILSLALALPGCSKKKGEEPAPAGDPGKAAAEGANAGATAPGGAAPATAGTTPN
ncbi:MAG: cytochrome c5 family protein, partial [Deltaproteobacteria bacterium]|nr:cytochrome c5 family protein [Deltaproteobacteria bacterium]